MTTTKSILSTAALAVALGFGAHGTAGAQAVNPGQPGSASGGVQAQTGMATPGGQQAGSARMSEDQVRGVLQARGYSDISGLERDGEAFKVKEAKRYGEKVEDLRINAATGQVRDEKRLSEDQAKKLLRDQGYSDVSDVKRDGDTIGAKAKRGDREMRLRVDARTGTVTQQQASN